MTDRSGLRRKIWVAFILQAAAISFAAVLGVYGASAVLKHLLIQRALQEEASHYWQRLEKNPAAQVPDTYNMSSFLLEKSQDAQQIPKPLRELPPGFHSLSQAEGGSLVLVDQRGDKRLLLLFKQEQVDALAFWFGMAPLALVLMVVYIIAWTTYRASRRAVSPVIWLASQVQRWDFKHPDASALRPENLPLDVEGETLVLASSLHDFATRIEQFVERERNFTRDASHELRTPLAVIRMAGDIMDSDDTLSPLMRKSLNRIRRAGRDMETLIEAFLILAREGDTGLPNEHFAVSEIVGDELEKVKVLVGNKPIELSAQIITDFEIDAPPRVLSVIVSNLLRNACNYTDKGSIKIIIEYGKVTVADSGIGMTPEQLQSVFEPFYRVDMKRDGQGIGLSIVRRLSHRYNWPVRLESEHGVGTRAIIEFPNVSKTSGMLPINDSAPPSLRESVSH